MSLKIDQLNLRLGGEHLLKDISLGVPDGSFFTVIGPNGAGKSLFVKCLLGFLKPTNGFVLIDGQPATRFPAREVGYVPQIKSFDRSFPASVGEIVLSGLSNTWPFRITNAEKVLVETSLKKVRGEHLVDQAFNQLSGGELQRVYLARSFIRKRKFLILDEPATGVDSFGEEDLYEMLESVRSEDGTTIIMVTHDLEVARHHSTHVLMLDRRALAFGSPQDCLKAEIIEQAFGHHQHQHDGVHSHA